MSTTDGLVLRARDLESKCGFNDGDEPDYLWDALDLDNRWPEYEDKLFWHDEIIYWVTERLLPLLPGTEVSTWDTIHNPIRTGWLPAELADVQVVVPWDEVLARLPQLPA